MAPKRLPESVIASAGMPSAAAAATASSTRAIPSTIEYSVCRRRWMKRGADMLASILLAPFREKLPKQRAALFGQKAALEPRVVVEGADGRQVDDAAAGAGLGVERPEDHPSDAGVEHGPDAHGTRLQGHEELATGEAVIAQVGGGFAHRDDLG